MINHQVQVATEMSCFDAVLHLNAVAMSEEKFFMESSLAQWFKADMIKRLTASSEIVISVENLEVTLLTDRKPSRLYVSYNYLYETHFILKGYLTKLVSVELSYELPLNN